MLLGGLSLAAVRGLLIAAAPSAAGGPRALALRSLAAPRPVGSSRLGDGACVTCTGRKILMPCTTREAHSFDFLTPYFLLYLLVDIPTMGTICVPAGTPEFLFYSPDYTHSHRSFWFSKFFIFGSWELLNLLVLSDIPCHSPNPVFLSG